MLEIKDLHASIDGKEILKGINLSVKPGEVHAIMGPNGSGKSTLSKILAGHPSYEVDSGSVSYEVNFKNEDLLELEAHERAQKGIFLAFQYPIELPGVSNFEFLKTSFNEICKSQGVDELDDEAFDKFVREKMKIVEMRDEFLHRPVNQGFSGGEKKRNEILQMAVLNPHLSILDETDSGLDIDALRVISEGVNKLKKSSNAIILITHYQRLLDYIKPDYVHVLSGGQIIRTGDSSLAKELEDKGYDWIVS
ncbi:MAG: Fe-S cluster assembly ATPase SufC [Bdellovibrionota bacterium]|nr:Fe-S cluster assembly ATPase SufC [Pseudobdellovibrionaceae bacterium]|tara:strand:+ start:52460 stop:53212 length:753 start_codon:yes stop_codon:yes gene_type:complete